MEPGAAGTRHAAARAYHWSVADRPTRALTASYEAALEAEAVGAYAAAVDHYERTLALWERAAPDTADLPAERVDVVERAADAARAAGDSERALEFTRQALVHVDPRDDPVRAGLLHARLGFHLYGLGLPGADEAFEQALRSVTTDPPSPERASVLGDFALILMLTGQDARARSVGEEALEVARAVGAAGPEAQALSVLGSISVERHELETALAMHRESCGSPRSSGTPSIGVGRTSTCPTHSGWPVISPGVWRQPSRAWRSHPRQASAGPRAIAEPAGHDANLLLSYFEVSPELAMWERRPDVAQEVLDRAVEMFDATDRAWLLPPVLAWVTAAVADAAGPGPDDGTIGTFHERVADQQKSKAELPPVQRPWVSVALAELSRLQAPTRSCGTRPRKTGTTR